jgi:hypothetical protein
MYPEIGSEDSIECWQGKYSAQEKVYMNIQKTALWEQKAELYM